MRARLLQTLALEGLLLGAAGGAIGAAIIGLGRFTTADDVDYAVARFAAVVRHLRQTAPV